MTVTTTDDSFHLDLAGYLGSDPEEVVSSFFASLDRLTTLRDGGKPAAALIEAEASARASLVYLESVVGPEDMELALWRCLRGCRRRSDLAALVTRSYLQANCR